MLVKLGVSIDRLARPMRRALSLIDEAFVFVTRNEAVLTSTYEGDHSSGSLHYDTENGACDFRLRHLDIKVRDDVRLKVKEKLDKKFGPRKYDVCFSVNDTILHVEYDPK